MKRILMICLTITLLLCGCTKETPHPTYTREPLRPVEPVGTVPAEFHAIVEENLFHYATVFPDRLLKSSVSSDSTEIRMYDHQGQLLLSHRVNTVSPFGLYALTATFDGGFLYVLGFSDFYDRETGQWASENGVYSLIRKFSADGQQQWETRVEGYTGWALRYCIEQNDGYSFFGSLETPETKTPGVASPDDISILKIGKDGAILQSRTIGGSDYDQLRQVQEENGNYIVYGRIQSIDGDFADSNVSESVNIWKITIDSDLNILFKTPVDWESIPDDPVGYLDGRAVAPADIFPDGFADGRITGVLDYGDFFLVISENNTGYYPTPPEISAQYYYTETVYGAYDKAGNVIWKAAVDSTRFDRSPANLKCDVQYADMPPEGTYEQIVQFLKDAGSA